MVFRKVQGPTPLPRGPGGSSGGGGGLLWVPIIIIVLLMLAFLAGLGR